MRQYNPVRKVGVDTTDPLEIELVYNVSSCGTCSFFWPDDPSTQPYGPYPSFDFTTNTPDGNPPGTASDYEWLTGITTDQGFPTGEIMDGCRKAPIMTIGINPNLTAFSPGQQGASWAYPNFTSDNGTDEFTKYAYYYRYRSVYQEHFNLADIKPYLLTDGQVVAPKSGVVKDSTRTSDSPAYQVHVLYDGDTLPTTINLPGVLGEPPYVLLFNSGSTNSRFNTGDIIAAKINVPAGIDISVYQGLIGYYQQFVPSLGAFQQYLISKGMTDADLQIGEDVCQLDMVACASPHWNDQYLGGSSASENTVISNCVSKNAWAIKQLVQTTPAVLYLVGESSYDMFYKAFSQFIKKNVPLSTHPVDGAFTLFSQTLNNADPCMFEYSTVINRQPYSISTRLIVTPHFSYNSNFLPQFRISQPVWANFHTQFAECYTYLFNNHDIQYAKGEGATGFVSLTLANNAAGILSELSTQYNDAYQLLQPLYYDPHNQMAAVLIDLYAAGKLAYTKPANGQRGYLTRTEGSCQFCVNSHWSFPLGCPYGKTTEAPPPPGFLQQVAQEIITKGKAAQALMEATQAFEAVPGRSLFVNR